MRMKVAVLVADGFEQAEMARPVRRLRREGAEVKIVSLEPGHIVGMNLMWRASRLRVDATVLDAEADQFDALLLPGGYFSPDTLRQNQAALALVRDFERAQKPIAMIGRAPWLLISAGLTRGRQLAAWPGIADDVRNAGATWVDRTVVHDQNWISSRSAKDLRQFNDALVAHLAGYAARRVAPSAVSTATDTDTGTDTATADAPRRRRLGLASLRSLVALAASAATAASAVAARRAWLRREATARR